MKIRRKVLLLFLFGAVVPLLVAMALHTLAFYRNATHAAQEVIGTSAEHAARRLDELMRGIGRDVRSLASDEALASAAPQQVSWRFANATYASPYLQELMWMGADGAILAASNGALVGRRLLERYAELDDDFDSVVRGAAGQLRVSDLDDVPRGARGQRPAGDTMQVLFMVRVDDRHGAFRGVLVGSVGAAIVADILEEVARSTPHALPVSEAGVSLVVFRQHVVARTHPYAACVVPAQAGTQSLTLPCRTVRTQRRWAPAFAGATNEA